MSQSADHYCSPSQLGCLCLTVVKSVVIRSPDGFSRKVSRRAGGIGPLMRQIPQDLDLILR